MTVTWMNVFAFCALAVAGAGLVLAARRLHLVIKATERRIAATVDEKNAAAAELRLARRDEKQIAQALQEAEEAIVQMTRLNELAEQRIAQLKSAPRTVVVMADQEWRRFDRLWRVRLMNPSMPNGVRALPGGVAAGDPSRLVHGYARSGAEFKARAEARFPPSAGFILGEAEMVDLQKPPPDSGAGTAADAEMGEATP